MHLEISPDLVDRMAQRVAVREADLCEEICTMFSALPVSETGMDIPNGLQLA